MNEHSLSKIVYGLLIFLFCAAGCQQRIKSAHYMSKEEWNENYQKRLKKDEAANKKKRSQPAKKR